MTSNLRISNAILWAAAIFAAAILGAPTFFTIILLPSLAITSNLLSRPKNPVGHGTFTNSVHFPPPPSA